MGISANEYAIEIIKKVLGMTQLNSQQHGKIIEEATDIVRRSWHQERAYLRKRIIQNIERKQIVTVGTVKMISVEDAKAAVDESR